MIFLLKFVFFVELIMLEFCRLFGFFFFLELMMLYLSYCLKDFNGVLL